MVHLLITFELSTGLLGDQTVSIVAPSLCTRGFCALAQIILERPRMGGSKKPQNRGLSFRKMIPRSSSASNCGCIPGQVFDRGEKSTVLDYSMLVDIYVLAESRCISRLQNHLVDIITRKSAHEGFSLRPSDGDMYSNTASSSPLRELAVHRAAHIGGLGHSSWELDRYPKEFLVALVLALHNKSGLEKDSDPKATFAASITCISKTKLSVLQARFPAHKTLWKMSKNDWKPFLCQSPSVCLSEKTYHSSKVSPPASFAEPLSHDRKATCHLSLG